MSKLYFVGDINFGCDPQLELIRKDIWDDYHSMNEDLISNWNENVTENDTIFVIGTFFNFTSSLTEKKEIYLRLNGRINHVNTGYEHGKMEEEIGITYQEARFRYKDYLIYVSNNFDFINKINCNFSVISNDNSMISKQNEKYIYIQEPYSDVTIMKNRLQSPIYNVFIDSWDFYPVSIDEILYFYSNYKKSEE